MALIFCFNAVAKHNHVAFLYNYLIIKYMQNKVCKSRQTLFLYTSEIQPIVQNHVVIIGGIKKILPARGGLFYCVHRLFLCVVFDCSLSSSKSCDWNAEWRT